MMIKELALAALKNYLSGNSGSADTSDGAGFLKELQRAHDGRAADPANRAAGSRPATDTAQAARTTKPAEPAPKRADDAQTRSAAGSAAGKRADADHPAATREARREGDTRSTKPAERDGSAADAATGADAAGAAGTAAKGDVDAAQREHTDRAEDSADTDRTQDAALALLAGTPATADPTATADAAMTAATAEAAARMLAAVRRTPGSTGAGAQGEAAAQAITDAAGGRRFGDAPVDATVAGEAGTDGAAAAAVDGAAGTGGEPAASTRTRRAALDATDLQRAGLDHDDRPLPTGVQTLAANLAQSARDTAAERIGALDGMARHERTAGTAAGHAGELPVGLAAGFANVLARAEASAATAAPVTAMVQAPLGSQAFAPEFAERISTLVANGIERAEIVVSPKELGPVRIELTMNGDDARLVFTAAHPDTRQAIEQSSALLRSMLADQGLTLGRMDVGQGGGDPQAGTGQQAPADTGTAQTWSGGGTAVATPAAAAPRGLLDLFA